MLLERRVTLRCLIEDLTSGWDNADHYRSAKSLRALIVRRMSDEIQDSEIAHLLRSMPRLNVLQHPLIRQFDSSFGPDEDPSSRESISGLASPHWWKQKTMQWRGAATDHSSVGADEVWLCAAGSRRQGDSDDFYASFMRNVRRAGAGPWLPADEDQLVGKIDEKILAMDAWKLQVHCSTLALLVEALGSPGATFSVRFPAPSRNGDSTDVGELSLSAETVDIDGEELTEVFLAARILDRAKTPSVDVAAQIARAALQSDAEAWNSTTYTEDAYAFSAVASEASRLHALELARTGRLPAASVPGDLRIGLRAHYAKKARLVDAQVDGSSVLSLCGYWFVPTTDHSGVDTCRDCAHHHERLEAG